MSKNTENLQNNDQFDFKNLPKHLIEQFHELKPRLSRTQAIYYNSELETLVISNNPKSPYLASYKLVNYNYQESSSYYSEDTKIIQTQQQKIKLIASITGENPSSDFFRFLNSKGLKFSELSELETLHNLKLFHIDEAELNVDLIQKIDQKITDLCSP